MSEAVSNVPDVALNDGHRIPQLGFGVWQVPPRDTARVVGEAFTVGYRHVDTAQMYANEAGVGEAVRASALPREALFVTTKCRNDAHGRSSAIEALEGSLERMGLDHVDLYLIHWPQPQRDQYVDTWEGFMEARERGLTRSIGVSNFHARHLTRLVAETGVTPAVNQIELHPRLTQEALAAASRRLGVAVESWSPLASGEILGEPALDSIAATHGKSVAQIVIRWHLQLGYVVIPKSVTPARIAENFDVFDFELSADEIAQIDGLNRESRTGWNPDQLG